MLEKLKSAYLVWFELRKTLPKSQRYSLAESIDKLLVETIEFATSAGFLPPNEKIPYLKVAIRKLDTTKIFIMMLWETKSFDDKQYLAISKPLDFIGADLGGWLGRMQKQNSPLAKTGEK